MVLSPPLCRLQSIRILLLIAAEIEYDIHAMDIQTAFIDAVEEEEAFVKMPPGYERSSRSGISLVMKPNIKLFGLC